MLIEFRSIGSWLTSGFSYLIGTYVHELVHLANLHPVAVLNLVYPLHAESEFEINPIDFDVIERNVAHIFEAAMKHASQTLPAAEFAARQEAVLAELKALYVSAAGVYEFEFSESPNPATEWEFAFLFLGTEHSCVARADAVWM